MYLEDSESYSTLDEDNVHCGLQSWGEIVPCYKNILSFEDLKIPNLIWIILSQCIVFPSLNLLPTMILVAYQIIQSK